MSTLPHCAPPAGHRGRRSPVGVGLVAPGVAQRHAGAVAQPFERLGPGLRVGERANGGGQPRGTNPGGVGSAEQRVVVDGADQ